jgi:hypothetical protein
MPNRWTLQNTSSWPCNGCRVKVMQCTYIHTIGFPESFFPLHAGIDLPEKEKTQRMEYYLSLLLGWLGVDRWLWMLGCEHGCLKLIVTMSFREWISRNTNHHTTIIGLWLGKSIYIYTHTHIHTHTYIYIYIELGYLWTLVVCLFTSNYIVHKPSLELIGISCLRLGIRCLWICMHTQRCIYIYT